MLNSVNKINYYDMMRMLWTLNIINEYNDYK